MTVQQKLAAIFAAEVGDEAGRARADRSELARVNCELIDPTISRFGGRIFALLEAGTLVEFAEPGPAVACALEVQRGLAERNAELAGEQRIGLGIGIEFGEVIAASGDVQGPAVAVARGLAREARAGTVAVSGGVARALARSRLGAEAVNRGVRTVAGRAKVEVIELHPVADPKRQSPWTIRRRWTVIAAIGAMVLLLGASVVLWRPVREWLFVPPTGAADVGTWQPGSHPE